MNRTKLHEATLETELSIEQVGLIHSAICRDCNIVQIKSKRTHIAKKLGNSILELSHLNLNDDTNMVISINALRPTIQAYKGAMSAYSLSGLYDTTKMNRRAKNTKAVTNLNKRFICDKCEYIGCFIRKSSINDEGDLGFIEVNTSGKCGHKWTASEAYSQPAFYEDSNAPKFNHKITMIEITFNEKSQAWEITPIYRQPNKQLFQYTGMKSVSGVNNFKGIAPMYRRNVQGKQTYFKSIIGHFNGFYALVMVNPDSEKFINNQPLFAYPPLGIVNPIGVREVKK
tara:strand:- start:5078 stop:5932 length:855 start_codon:yes stop_codon:yes gene_type:complete